MAKKPVPIKDYVEVNWMKAIGTAIGLCFGIAIVVGITIWLR